MSNYLQPISRLKAFDNLGGVIDIQVARAADIISIPAPVEDVVYGDIVFAEGTGFVKWEVTQESASISSPTKRTREGSTKSNTLPFRIPKDRIGIRSRLARAEKDEFIVLYKYANGAQKLFGLLEAPVQFEFSHDSGDKFSGSNFYSCRFYYDGPDNTYFYQGAITVAPTSTGLCRVEFLSGELIALLNPSDTLILSSDFHHTFTLVPGIGGGAVPAIVKWDTGEIIASLQPGDKLIADTDFTFDFEIIGNP